MGGAYFKQYADWNVLCDTEAADVMFRGVDRLECIGADVTHRAVASDALYDSLMHYDGTEMGRCYLSKLCSIWRRLCPQADLVLHDPLVMYYLADPTICALKKASVVVITDGYARAMTLNVDAYKKKKYNPSAFADFDDERKVLVAKTVDVDAFFAYVLRDFEV